MPIQVLDVVTRVRHAISDAVAPYRWEDGELWLYIADGFVQIAARNPEAQYETEVSNSEPASISSNDDQIGLTREYLDSLVHYTVFRSLAKDAEDNANLALSQEHFNKFVAFLQ